MDLRTLVDKLHRDGRVRTIARNPLAQFGRPNRRYLGATLLPEQTVEENAYRETSIKYRTIIANDGTRYSPTQLKAGELVGDMLVELAESDIKREFTAREYDALIKQLMRNDDMDAMLTLINWIDTTLNLALAERNEAARWQAIEQALVQRRGFNNYAEDVAYSNPAGHRVNAGDLWSDNDYDPFIDLYAQAQVLINKGFTPARIITSRRVTTILTNNAKVAARMGRVVITGGSFTASGERPTMAAINGLLASDDLPPIETYDLQYRTETGSQRFLSDDVLIMTANTGRDEEIDFGDEEPMFLPNTLGYVGIGRPAGQAEPGRVIRTEVHESKPPRIEGEAWQTSLPVILEPEAITVIGAIN
jgi:hypothetical protein